MNAYHHNHLKSLKSFAVHIVRIIDWVMVSDALANNEKLKKKNMLFVKFQIEFGDNVRCWSYHFIFGRRYRWWILE